MSERHCELMPMRWPTAGMMSEFEVGAVGSSGTTGVTRLIDTGTDLPLDVVTFLLFVSGENTTMIVAVNVPFGSDAGSIAMSSVIPSAGMTPLDGVILTIHGLSPVAVKFSACPSPGMKTCT